MSASWGAQLANPNTNTSTGAVAAGTAVTCPGGNMAVLASSSNWNGATATIQILGPDGSTWLTASSTNGVFTANGTGVIQLPPCSVCVSVSGSPTSLYCTIARIVA